MNTQMRATGPEASGEAPRPEGDDSNMGTVPTSGPEATSSQGKHTPGPWFTAQAAHRNGPEGSLDYAISDGSRKIIAEAFEIVGYADDTRTTYDRRPVEANARLIAAAPDLLATLQQIARLSRDADRERLDVATMLGEIAHAAIAKATHP